MENYTYQYTQNFADGETTKITVTGTEKAIMNFIQLNQPTLWEQYKNRCNSPMRIKTLADMTSKLSGIFLTENK